MLVMRLQVAVAAIVRALTRRLAPKRAAAGARLAIRRCVAEEAEDPIPAPVHAPHARDPAREEPTRPRYNNTNTTTINFFFNSCLLSLISCNTRQDLLGFGKRTGGQLY